MITVPLKVPKLRNYCLQQSCFDGCAKWSPPTVPLLTSVKSGRMRGSLGAYTKHHPLGLQAKTKPRNTKRSIILHCRLMSEVLESHRQNSEKKRARRSIMPCSRQHRCHISHFPLEVGIVLAKRQNHPPPETPSLCTQRRPRPPAHPNTSLKISLKMK